MPSAMARPSSRCSCVERKQMLTTVVGVSANASRSSVSGTTIEWSCGSHSLTGISGRLEVER